MKIDEAILHLYDVAFSNMKNDDCVKNNLKIAHWLEDLQEREKGCVYCKNKNAKEVLVFQGVPVKYCPMCGKQIRKDEENEYNENSD